MHYFDNVIYGASKAYGLSAPVDSFENANVSSGYLPQQVKALWIRYYALFCDCRLRRRG